MPIAPTRRVPQRAGWFAIRILRIPTRLAVMVSRRRPFAGVVAAVLTPAPRRTTRTPRRPRPFRVTEIRSTVGRPI